MSSTAGGPAGSVSTRLALRPHLGKFAHHPDSPLYRTQCGGHIRPHQLFPIFLTTGAIL